MDGWEQPKRQIPAFNVMMMRARRHSPFDTPVCPMHKPRNVEYNEVFLFLCTLGMF